MGRRRRRGLAGWGGLRSELKGRTSFAVLHEGGLNRHRSKAPAHLGRLRHPVYREMSCGTAAAANGQDRCADGLERKIAMNEGVDLVERKWLKLITQDTQV